MVERCWPGSMSTAMHDSVTELDGKCLELAAKAPIRYLGATFILADESLLRRFDGTEPAVRATN